MKMIILASAFLFSGAELTFNAATEGNSQRISLSELKAEARTNNRKINCVDFAFDMANQEELYSGDDFTEDDWMQSYWFHIENCDPDMVIIESISLP